MGGYRGINDFVDARGRGGWTSTPEPQRTFEPVYGPAPGAVQMAPARSAEPMPGPRTGAGPADVYGKLWWDVINASGHPAAKREARGLLERLQVGTSVGTLGAQNQLLLAAGTLDIPLTVRTDAYFVALELRGRSSDTAAVWTTQIQQQSGGLNLISTPMTQDLVWGTAVQPGKLPVPHVFGPGELITIKLVGRTATGADHRLDLHLVGSWLFVADPMGA